jgi:hypothetical protein
VQPGGTLSVAPVLELFDLEHAVGAVSLFAEARSGCVGRRCKYIAAGTDDGNLVVWKVMECNDSGELLVGQVLAKLPVSGAKR